MVALGQSEHEEVLGLVEEYEPFIQIMAGRYSDSQFSFEDFRQEAVLTIIKAYLRRDGVDDFRVYVKSAIVNRMMQLFKQQSMNLNMAPRCRREPRVSMDLLREETRFDVASSENLLETAIANELQVRIFELLSPWAAEVLHLMLEPDEKLCQIVVRDAKRMEEKNLRMKRSGRLPMSLTMFLRQRHLAEYYSVSKATLSRVVTEIRTVTTGLISQEV